MAARRSWLCMDVGETIRVREYRLDGTCNRWWSATVESVETDGVVLVTHVGHRVEGVHGGWTSEYAIRAFYWLN